MTKGLDNIISKDEQLKITKEYESEINQLISGHKNIQNNYYQEKYIFNISNYFDIKCMDQLIRSEINSTQFSTKLDNFINNVPVFIEYDIIGFKMFILFARCYYFQSDEFDAMINKI